MKTLWMTVMCAAVLARGASGQACLVCDPSVSLSAPEATCFLEHVEHYEAEAAIAEPVLINFGSCAGGGGQSSTPTRGVPVLPERGETEVACTGDACGRSPSFAFLSAAQVACLALRLRAAERPEAEGRVTIDLSDCG